MNNNRILDFRCLNKQQLLNLDRLGKQKLSQYNSLIKKIGNNFNNSLEWWATELGARNEFATKFYYYLLTLLLFLFVLANLFHLSDVFLCLNYSWINIPHKSSSFRCTVYAAIYYIFLRFFLFNFNFKYF